MKFILNVAEKPSVAKAIMKYLSNGRAENVGGRSKFNPVYEFDYNLQGEHVKMRVTSVQGHVMNMEFVEPYNNWKSVSIEELFTAPIQKMISSDKNDIVKNLQECSRGIDILALWLDCDREGENIAFEVVDIVTKATQLRPNNIKRAVFSALTKVDIENAIQNLEYPKQELSESVDARMELDLRLGAIFTRLQTLRLRNASPFLANQPLISWGPCQFPTLGFVVKRQLEILNFKPEQYWTLDMKVNRGANKTAEFSWSRARLFDFTSTLVLYEKCIEAGQAEIVSIEKNEKNKCRPYPLSTISFQKLVSSKLKIDSDESMKIAEKLYNNGLISYPRTETDFFKTTINLKNLIESQAESGDWGDYSRRLLDGDFKWPKAGQHDDNSHPPIHPVKLATRQDLNGKEWQIYELVTRHFLACCSLDAKGFETVVIAQMGGETFEAKGLQVVELNFLEIYPYMKWSENELPIFNDGEVFVPNELMMNEHTTQPPPLLSESDLISLMDKSGIGTDATIHQHIKTIQDRKYAEKTPNQLFKPTQLGMALVQGYANMGARIHEPELRAKTEKGMNEVAARNKSRQELIRETLGEMEDVYRFVVDRFNMLSDAVKNLITAPLQSNNQITCYKCGESGHYANNCTSTRPPLSIRAVNENQAAPQQGQNACFKCGKPGHFANACTEDKNKTNKQAKTGKKKVCELCGVEGRHPKGSTCEHAKRKKPANK
ncbi:unnamed protein product [Blepharisma stoltei]|uniref:DNA topoisomerase n=1 Tax=Blepharisma stoltei TaxID=1481888 RepID=A0AAU9J4Z0_9CILI|nr:unnamed protein product [Blepharisma stoltei]